MFCILISSAFVAISSSGVETTTASSSSSSRGLLQYQHWSPCNYWRQAGPGQKADCLFFKHKDKGKYQDRNKDRDKDKDGHLTTQCPGVRACPVLGFDGDNAVRGHLQRCQGKVSVWLVFTSFATLSFLQDPLNFETNPIPKYKTKSPSNDFSSYLFCQFPWRPREEGAFEGVEESLWDGGQGKVSTLPELVCWHWLLT